MGQGPLCPGFLDSALSPLPLLSLLTSQVLLAHSPPPPLPPTAPKDLELSSLSPVSEPPESFTHPPTRGPLVLPPPPPPPPYRDPLPQGLLSSGFLNRRPRLPPPPLLPHSFPNS